MASRGRDRGFMLPVPMDEHPSEDRGDVAVARIEAIAAEVGFDVRHLAPFILERMRLLASSSETFSDGARMAAFARKVFARYDEVNPDRPWTAMERRTVVLGSLFSDIGKTGPLHATEEGQRLVTEMFAVERVDDETQSVATFLRAYFPHDAERRISLFGALGLDASMSLRGFWNLHAGFTLDIVEAGGVPKEAVAAAATHHFLDDVNPDGVVCEDGRFSRPYGENEGFDRAEKLVIVLDKYDAVRRRGACAHDDAIGWLRRWVERRERFRDDTELFALIDVVDAALRND